MTIPLMISPLCFSLLCFTLIFVQLYYSRSQSTRRVQDLLVIGKRITIGILRTWVSPSSLYLHMECLLPTHPGMCCLVFLLLAHVHHRHIIGTLVGQINDLNCCRT